MSPSPEETDGAPRVRLARDRTDIEACVALQRAVWGVNDLEIAGPVQLVATTHAGGILQVAEDEAGVIVGFVYAFPGLHDGEPHMHSDMLAVLPGARGRGLGLKLKWAQRGEALARGVSLVTWTFDPLQAPNARLNLRHLGATATEWLPNLYGTTSSALHQGLPTDRLGVRWELESPIVKERARGRTPPPAASFLDAPRVNRVEGDGDTPESSVPHLDLEDPVVLFEIPPDWGTLCEEAPDAAARWQEQAGAVFGAYLGRGYRAVDLVTVMESGHPRPRYVLHRM